MSIEDIQIGPEYRVPLHFQEFDSKLKWTWTLDFLGTDRRGYEGHIINRTKPDQFDLTNMYESLCSIIPRKSLTSHLLSQLDCNFGLVPELSDSLSF